MASEPQLSMRSKSGVLSLKRYSFGATVRSRPTGMASASISRSSALERSTGCRSLEPNFANTPLTAPSTLFSKRSRTLIVTLSILTYPTLIYQPCEFSGASVRRVFLWERMDCNGLPFHCTHTAPPCSRGFHIAYYAPDPQESAIVRPMYLRSVLRMLP